MYTYSNIVKQKYSKWNLMLLDGREEYKDKSKKQLKN